ncbi:SCO family protein [Paenalcaligenes niemegkensis]|nr:SCO family protein [Paenalcaligenes niemegkensis]MCQ9617726.1 SCO family protein [Paenalcaligenes niemegkensis]
MVFILSACSPSAEEMQFNGSNISGSNLGADLTMVDGEGNLRTLESFSGKVVVVFFGFTQCPDICPTALSQLAAAMELLGNDADKVQVLLITVDPERDTPEIIAEYVRAFDERFLGLTGSPAQLHKTAQSFKAFYAKVPGPTPEQYTMDHSSSFYILDGKGEARVLLRGDATPEEISQDIKQLLPTAS